MSNRPYQRNYKGLNQLLADHGIKKEFDANICYERLVEAFNVIGDAVCQAINETDNALEAKNILMVAPEHVNKFDLTMFTDYDLVNLIVAQPELHKHFDMDRIARSTGVAEMVMNVQPVLAKVLNPRVKAFEAMRDEEAQKIALAPYENMKAATEQKTDFPTQVPHSDSDTTR